MSLKGGVSSKITLISTATSRLSNGTIEESYMSRIGSPTRPGQTVQIVRFLLDAATVAVVRASD